MQRIKEAVAVKPTLKSLRDEISFLKVGFDAPLHSRVACIGSKGDFFSLMCRCIYVCVYERVGAGEKNYEEPGDSEFRSVLCQLRYTIRGATHVRDQGNIITLFIFSSIMCNLGRT